MDTIFSLISLLLTVALFVGVYKTFAKMGYEDAWWALIPILNVVFMLKVAEKPIWWIVLLFIPIVNFVVFIYVAWLVASKVSAAYGKSVGFTVGLIVPFVNAILYMILGLGSEQPQKVA